MMNVKEEPSPIQWINQLLARRHLPRCEVHKFRNSDTNKFCIDCVTPACYHCMSEGLHDHHRVLRIYILYYTNVIPRDDIIGHLDCSGIQPFRCNGQTVLALHPLPHRGKGNYKQCFLCRACSRKLRNPHEYQYCSIACKIKEEMPTAPKSTVKRPGAGAGPSDKTSPKLIRVKLESQ